MCRATMTTHSDDSSVLPEWFKPCDMDVICGWARQNHHHVGNKHFRSLIEEYAPQYVAATSKLEKTQVIAALIDKVRSGSPDGGFVKKDFYSGRWYEIGNEKARDKVGHAIRKAAEELQKGKRKGTKKKSKAFTRSNKTPAKKGSTCTLTNSTTAGNISGSQIAPTIDQLSSFSHLYPDDLLGSSSQAIPSLSRQFLHDGQVMPRLSVASNGHFNQVPNDSAIQYHMYRLQRLGALSNRTHFPPLLSFHDRAEIGGIAMNPMRGMASIQPDARAAINPFMTSLRGLNMQGSGGVSELSAGLRREDSLIPLNTGSQHVGNIGQFLSNRTTHQQIGTSSLVPFGQLLDQNISKQSKGK